MKSVKFSALLSVVLALGACSHYSEELSSLDGEMSKPANTTIAMKAPAPQDIAPAAGGMPIGYQAAVAAPVAFPQVLAREYYALAKYENDKAYDYKASKIFTQKALMASQGKTVTPSAIKSFDLTPSRAAELATARAELADALKYQNTPDNAEGLAKAQTRFECWIDRAEEAANDDHYASCKQEFEAAMASLVTPAAGTPDMMDIMFEPGTAQVNAQSAATLDGIAQFMMNPSNAGYNLSMMGVMVQTEPTTLTSDRLKSLQDALVMKGVAQTRIQAGFSPQVLAQGAPAGIVRVMMVAPQIPTRAATKAEVSASDGSPIDAMFQEGKAPKTN